MICSATGFFLLKPHCSEANKPLDSRTHINQLFTIFSIDFHKQIVKGIGRQLLGSEEFLPDFVTATTLASLKEGEHIPDSQMD